MLIVESKMFRCSYDNQYLEEISESVISAKVAMDTDREETWTLDCTMTWAGWQRLRPFYDWLAPCLKVTYPDGTVRGGFDARGQLGLYMVLDSPERHPETDASVTVEAGDRLWLLGRQGSGLESQLGSLVVKVPKKGRPGITKTSVVKALLDEAVLTDTSSGRRLYAVPNDAEQFKHTMEFDPDLSKLEVCNQILQGVGMYPLRTTKTGVIVSHRMGETRLKHKHPVRTFSANLPPDMVLARRDRPFGGLPSDLAGVVQTTPKGADMVNEILIVSDNVDGPNIFVRGRITHPKNPRAVFHNRGRHRTRKVHNAVLDDDATANQVARALTDQLSTMNSTVRVPVFPDPETEFGRETVNLFIWNAAGDQVANGQYAVHRVDYQLTPPYTMTIDCGRIDDAEDYLQGAA